MLGLRGIRRDGASAGAHSDRFERFNIVVAILLAGWVPSILMLVVSYTILTNTLETKILRDRQTFVELVAHMVGDDLGRTGGIIEYYQTQPDIAKTLQEPNAAAAAQQWVNDTFYSHPRIDGLFIVSRDGKLIASVPAVSAEASDVFSPDLWRDGATAAPGAFVSPIHPRPSDGRRVTDIVGAVRAQDGTIVGYLGVSVLVERIGRRLSSIQMQDQSLCQVLDQTGTPLFAANFAPNSGEVPAQDSEVIRQIRRTKTGHIETRGKLYSFSPVENTGWLTVVEQPRSAAYRPVTDLLNKITVPVVWLIVLTAVAAWLAGKFTRRQREAQRRIEREVIFNEKILANMPSGIALIDPESRNFLQANDAFARMAKQLGGLAAERDIYDTTYDEVKIAPAEAVERVLKFGTPFQLIEQPFTDTRGQTHFVNVNMLRLQGAERIQGVLYLVEDKTRDVTLRQELMGANAAKDQFLATLSHELRNPLTPVIAMVTELEASSTQSEDVRFALEVIRRNVELEARLIDDLLDVTRIARGKLQLALEKVSIHEILRRAYEICRDEIVAKNLNTEFRLRAEHDYVQGDSARLQQVFWNLMKNSVKFTPPGGRIIVETANPATDRIEIRITDTGLGIEREQLERIFNAFEQGQTAITRRFGGLGLGLAISKAMVQAHNGRICAESGGRDSGATFIVELASVAAPVESQEGKIAPVAAPAGNGAGTDGRRRRILVVDDHRDTCTGLQMILQRRGYEVATAHTAEEALSKATSDDFDLVISDIGLPDRSGYELMQELRGTKNVRGIALSGYGMESDIRRAHEAGFSQHLTKPINIDQLSTAIHELFEPEESVR